MEHRERLVRWKGAEEAGRVGPMDGGLECSWLRRLSSLERCVLASRDERPLVEVLLPLEWNVEWWILAFAWDGDASRAIEDGVDLRVLYFLFFVFFVQGT